MAKTFQVLKLSNNGVSYIVIKHPGEVNPYWLYERWWDMGEHKKLIQKYSDLASCLHCIIGMAYDDSRHANCMYAV